MRNRRNYYRILHVQRDAPAEIIKSSYRTLMQRLRMHPDLGGDQWNASLLNEAYRVLTDPARRAEYDRSLPRLDREQAAEEPPRPVGPGAGGPDRRTARAMERCPFCHAAAGHGESRDPACPRCGSPLSRPPLGPDRADWLRAVDRVPQDTGLRFWTGWPDAIAHEGRLLDLSLTGLRLATARSLLPDQFLKIECARFQAVARVVRTRPADAMLEIGAEFLTLRFARSRGSLLSDRA